MFSIIMLMALLPVAILLIYIYHVDRKSPEPASQLFKAFFYGTLCVPITMFLVIPMEFIGMFSSAPATVYEAITVSFIGAAIPEECIKLLMLWLLLRKNRHFDERLDGIVYAASVSLGFAAIENILYLFDNQDSFIAVGITRGILSIPLHFSCGVLMGYFYSLTKFCKKAKATNRLLIFIAPMLVHGIYDSILFSIGIICEDSIPTTLLLFFTLVTFCIATLLVCYRSINRLRQMDMKELPLEGKNFVDATNGYSPQPADCTAVQLPKELDALLEALSRNVHEVWAHERMKEGWSFGPQRNEIIKKHPCLIPYEQLPESEKDYDRNTAIGTLKFIIKSGYRIIKEEPREENDEKPYEEPKERTEEASIENTHPTV